MFSNVDFKKDWKHTLQKDKWVRKQVDFHAKLKGCLTEVKPLSRSEAHAIVDPLGATFLEAMTAALHETWNSQPKTGKIGVSVNDCATMKALKAIHIWRAAKAGEDKR